MNINFRRYIKACDSILFTVEPHNHMILHAAFAAMYLKHTIYDFERSDKPEHSQNFAVDMGIIYG